MRVGEARVDPPPVCANNRVRRIAITASLEQDVGETLVPGARLLTNARTKERLLGRLNHRRSRAKKPFVPPADVGQLQALWQRPWRYHR